MYQLYHLQPPTAFKSVNKYSSLHLFPHVCPPFNKPAFIGVPYLKQSRTMALPTYISHLNPLEFMSPLVFTLGVCWGLQVHQLEHPERTMQRSGSQRSHRDSPDGSPRPSLGADSALASRSPPSVGRPSARPDRSSRSAPLISLEDLDMEQVESVIVTPTNQLKQKHLVFAMVQEFLYSDWCGSSAPVGVMV